MTSLQDIRVYYVHDANCSTTNFTEINQQTGLKVCKDCAGVFDKDGKGVCVTSKKFDKPIA